MRRAGSALLLIVCLIVLGDTPTRVVANIALQQHSGCCQHDPAPANDCGGCTGDQSTPNQCCTPSCCGVIAWSAPLHRMSISDDAGKALPPRDQIFNERDERPPVPPPRV